MLKGVDYCITSANILAHELIGLDAKVVKSTDNARVGVKGRVVDETKNTLTIEGAGEIVVPKNEAVFEFSIGSEKVVVDGKKIMYAPEQRVKALWRGLNG